MQDPSHGVLDQHLCAPVSAMRAVVERSCAETMYGTSTIGPKSEACVIGEQRPGHPYRRIVLQGCILLHQRRDLRSALWLVVSPRPHQQEASIHIPRSAGPRQLSNPGFPLLTLAAIALEGRTSKPLSL